MSQLPANLRARFTPPARLRSALMAFGSTVLVSSVVVAGVVVILKQLGLLQQAELSAYDTLIQLRQAEPLDDRLLVVGIDETDIQTRNEYPLHDGTLATLLRVLAENEPRAIGIDIARDVPQGTGREALTRQLAGSDRIIAACVLSSAREPGVAPPPGVPSDRTAFADFPQDADSVIRRSILISTPAPSQAPIVNPSVCSEVNPNNQRVSLSLALALLYLKAEGIEPKPTQTGELQLGSTVFTPLTERAGGYHSTGATDYQVMLNYRSPSSIRQVSLTDVLEKRIDPDWVRDRIILIGYTSQIAKDFFFTPFSESAEDTRAMPGVTIHAQSTSQILSAVLHQRQLIWYWSDGVEILWIVAWSLAGGTIAWFIRKTWLFLVLEGVTVGVLWGLCYVLLLYSGWVPLVPPAIALAASAIGVVLVDRAHQGGYTQAIYEQVKDQVKVVLKPKIEIDPEKRAKQVAEITETGYFQDLVQRAKAIREQRASQEAAKQQPPDER